MKEEEKTPYDIAIIGDFNMDWDLVFIKPLFEKIGCRVVAVFTGGERLHNLFKIPDVKLNVLHCQRSCTYISELIKKGYEVPYINVSLFGIEQTANALRKTAEFFGSKEMMERAEQVIEEELKAIMPALNFYREKLRGKKVGLYVGGPRVWHWQKVFHELEMEVVFGMCTFAHEDDYEN
jgi:nitrogenase molybdenum-iron protein alpha chain